MSQVCCRVTVPVAGRPLLTHASAGDTQTLKGRSGSVSVGPLGPGAHKVLFEPSKCLWEVLDLILNATSPLLPSCCIFSFALWHVLSFFGGIQHAPVDGSSAVSCNFGVLTEDEHMSFYSAIFKLLVSEQVTSTWFNFLQSQGFKAWEKALVWAAGMSILQNQLEISSKTTKVLCSQSYGFSTSHVWRWELDLKKAAAAA